MTRYWRPFAEEIPPFQCGMPNAEAIGRGVEKRNICTR
jgi:hypothetical protein